MEGAHHTFRNEKDVMLQAHIDPDGYIHAADGESFTVSRDPQRWVAWLEQGHPFRLEGLHVAGHSITLATLRSKRLRHLGLRWYAYRRVRGDLREIFVGRSEQLTLAHLRAIVCLLG